MRAVEDIFAGFGEPPPKPKPKRKRARKKPTGGKRSHPFAPPSKE